MLAKLSKCPAKLTDQTTIIAVNGNSKGQYKSFRHWVICSMCVCACVRKCVCMCARSYPCESLRRAL